MRVAELVMAIAMAVFSLLLMWKSTELPIGWIPGEGPGGGAFPFWLSLGIAILLHLILVALNPFQQQAQKAPRPLTTKFVKRQPRLTKALELRKIPKFKRQMIRREVQMAKARMDQVQATAAFSTRAIIARATSPSQMQFVLPMHPQSRHVVLEPQMRMDVDLGISRTAENKIDMGLEMLDVDAMDTGRYRAMVIQDPNDKQALKGFIKLARVVSSSYVAETQTNVVDSGLNNQEIDILRDMLNEWTACRPTLRVVSPLTTTACWRCRSSSPRVHPTKARWRI